MTLYSFTYRCPAGHGLSSYAPSDGETVRCTADTRTPDEREADEPFRACGAELECLR